MKRAIAGLLHRKTELPTAIEIKQSKWSPPDSVELLRRLVPRHPKLHKDTIGAIQSHVQSFRDPLDRYEGLAQLSELGNIDRDLAAQMHAHFGQFEQAVQLGYTNTLNDAKIHALLKIGAIQEVVDLVLATYYSLSPETWNLMIQLLIEAKEYQRACSIWFCKPRNIRPPYWTVRHFFILAAQHHDMEMLAELEPLVPNKSDPVLQKYLLDSIDDPKVLLAALRKHQMVIGGGSCLAAHLPEILPQLEPNSPNSVYNSILMGCLDTYTSLFVFAVYRFLQSTGFVADTTTAQILANACHRLGNSKIVSHSVWNEMVEVCKVAPTRKFCETMIQSQFNGTGIRTSLFYLYQMHSRGLYLRNNLHFSLIGRFGDDQAYTQLYGDIRRLKEYSIWDPELAMAESGKYVGQAERNSRAFTSSKSAEEIVAMLEFERARTDTPA